MHTTPCFLLQPLENRTLLSAYYSITDLGSLGGGEASASDVNNNGLVVGTSTDESGIAHAFLWTHSLSDCGPESTMLPIDIPGSNDVSASFINDDGVILGTAGFNENGSTHYRVFRYSQGKVEFLAMDDAYNNFAAGINDSGQMITTRTLANSSDSSQIIFYDNSLTNFTVVGTDEVEGFNNSGVIATQRGLDSQHNPDFDDRLVMATAINDRGTVAWTHNLDPSIPTNILNIRDDTQTRRLMLTDAGASFGFNVHMNNQATLIGNTNFADGHTLVWILDRNTLRDLNSLIPANSPFQVDAMQAINDHGQIIANVQIDGQPHAVLLTPTGEPFPTQLGATDIQLQELPPIESAAKTNSVASKHRHTARTARHHHRPHHKPAHHAPVWRTDRSD